MGAIEINSASSVCRRCGMSYGRLKGNFPVSYGSLYKGVGYLPYCRSCVDAVYSDYYADCKDAKQAVRQTCRKIDIYWNESVFNTANSNTSNRSLMTAYLQRLSMSSSISNKTYDDTLKEEGTMWSWGRIEYINTAPEPSNAPEAETDDYSDITEEVIEYWGPGYTQDMLRILEKRRKYWENQMGGELDVGSSALIRQICGIEIDINYMRAKGQSAEKLQTTLNTLIGSLNIKPNQKKDDSDTSLGATPLGVWIWRWENKRPLPEVDPELQDVDGIVRYILTWFYGHLAKMLNIKNAHSSLYEKEIEKYRVMKPEFDDEDDEAFMSDIFADNESPERSEGGDEAERQ